MVACGEGAAEPGGGSQAVAASTTTSTTTASTTNPPPATASVDGCADVIDATIVAASEGFTISATVRSADTGWEKYADLWVVRGPDGAVLGERVLAHPHVTEQPFTRSLAGIEIPDGIAEVTIAARDSVVGFCGGEYVAEVPSP